MKYKTAIDAKTIILNLMNNDKKDCVSIHRLKQLLEFIYSELSHQDKLEQYKICFELNTDSIERIVYYNSDIFALNMDKQIIFLRSGLSISELVDNYEIDSVINSILNEFCINEIE